MLTEVHTGAWTRGLGLQHIFRCGSSSKPLSLRLSGCISCWRKRGEKSNNLLDSSLYVKYEVKWNEKNWEWDDRVFLSDRKRLEAIGLIATHSSPASAGADPLCSSVPHQRDIFGKGCPCQVSLEKHCVLGGLPASTTFPAAPAELPFQHIPRSSSF